MKQEYSKIYRELCPEKTGSFFDLEDPLCWRFKTTHILIASQAKTSIYPHQWDSGARTGARPGLRESIPALPLFILPRVIYGTSRNGCKVVNCVFTPTDNKSDAQIHPLNFSTGFRSTGSTFYTVSNRYLFMVINQNPMTAGLGNWPFLASNDAAQW